MIRNLSLFTALAALSPLAHAFVLIDDFTAGGYSKQLTGETSFTFDETGLDTAHAVFGQRGHTTRINSNPNGATLNLHVGGGEQSFRSDLQLCYLNDMVLGGGGLTVDFSREIEFWFDLTTDPPGSLAENWSMSVLDADGRSTGNGGWLFRPEGIRFRKEAFSQQVDWERITLIQVTQYWNSFPNPTDYTVTKIYAVPEPGTMAALLGGLLAVRTRRSGRRRG